MCRHFACLPPFHAGLVWGWPAAAPLLAPFLALALWRGRAASIMPTLLLCLLATLGPQLLVDRVFYGRWVVRAFVLPSRPRFSVVVSCLAGEHALPGSPAIFLAEQERGSHT